MALYGGPLTLQQTLEQKGERVFRNKDDVLFRRGDAAFGMFVVLGGRVSLDFGVDSPRSRSYGPGTLLGLPATLTRRSYRMTATVSADAELSLWTTAALNSLLRKRRDFCQRLLTILGEKMDENRAVAKSLAYGDKQLPQGSHVA